MDPRDDVEPLVGVPSFHDVYETINHDKAVDAFCQNRVPQT